MFFSKFLIAAILLVAAGIVVSAAEKNDVPSISARLACAQMPVSVCVASQTNTTAPVRCHYCPTAVGAGECLPIAVKCDCTKIMVPNGCASNSIFQNCEWCAQGDHHGYCITGGTGTGCKCAGQSRDSCELNEQCRACPQGEKDWTCVPASTQCPCTAIQSLNTCIAAGTRAGGQCAWCPIAAKGPFGGDCGASSRICPCSVMGVDTCGAYPYCRWCSTGPATGRCQKLSDQC